MSDIHKLRETKDDELEIDLLPILKALWKKAWLIILVAVIIAGVAFAGSKLFITPKYRSTFTAYVNNRSGQDNNNTLTSSDLSASQSLVRTYSAIICSRSILEEAAKEANAPYSYTQVVDLVSTEVVNDTEIISVSVTMEDRQMAAALAHAIADIAPDFVAQIVEGSSMQIVDAAVIPVEIYSPNYVRISILGGVLGALIVVLIIVLREILDDRVKDSDDLEARFQIPVIGIIPNMESAEKIGKAYGYGSNAKGR